MKRSYSEFPGSTNDASTTTRIIPILIKAGTVSVACSTISAVIFSYFYGIDRISEGIITGAGTGFVNSITADCISECIDSCYTNNKCSKLIGEGTHLHEIQE